MGSDLYIAMYDTAIVCVILATLISIWLISNHLKHFNIPSIQSKIIGIVWMVPIYSVDSFLSLSFPKSALYLDMLRDCYEVL